MQLSQLCFLLSALVVGGGWCAPKILERRVYGSAIADLDKYPFFVLVKGDNKLCGGTLYTNDIVLTARHCAWGSWYQYSVYINMKDYTNWGPASYTKVGVKEIISHPDFIEGHIPHYDVALMKLNRPNSSQRLIKLDGADIGSMEGQTVRVFGWSNNTSQRTEAVVDQPREVMLQIQNSPQCLAATEQLGEINPNHAGSNWAGRKQLKLERGSEAYKVYNFDSDIEICLGSSDGPPPHTKGLAPGDSGSPIIYEAGPGSSPVLVGVASWIYDNEDPKTIGRLTFAVRVQRFSQWIEQTTNALHEKYKPTIWDQILPNPVFMR